MSDPLLNGRTLESYRVLDLGVELEQRGLSKSGVKKELIARLKTYLIENEQSSSDPTPSEDTPEEKPEPHDDQESKLPSVNIDKELTGNHFIRDYLAQRESLYKEANTSNDESANEKEGSPEPEKPNEISKEVRSKPVVEIVVGPPSTAPVQAKEAAPVAPEILVPPPKEEAKTSAPEAAHVPDSAPKEGLGKEKRVEPQADELRAGEPQAEVVPEEDQENGMEDLGLSLEVSKEDDVVMQDEEQSQEKEKNKKLEDKEIRTSSQKKREEKKPEENKKVPEETEKKKVREETETVEEITSIRTIGNPVKERQKRQWSRSKSKNSVTTTEISSATLKDIVPDIKPLLEEESVELTVVEEEKSFGDEKETDNDKKEGEEIHSSNETEKDAELNAAVIANVKPTIEEATDEEEREESSEPAYVHVSNLVRPFTVNQLKELLSRTGEIDNNENNEGFLINKIKSECLVKYKRVSQAKETVTSLDGVKWPTSNPKKLQVKLTDEEKFLRFKQNLDATSTSISLSRNNRPAEVDRKRSRPQSPEKAPRVEKKRDRKDSTKSLKTETTEKPKQLEELFNKTKSSPNIYWKMAKKLATASS